MVAVAYHQALRPVHEGCRPRGVARQLAAQSVFLDVCLVHYVYAVLVAEFVPAWVVGVVACAHGVDVALLEQSYFLFHALVGHHLAHNWVHLVAVYSAEACGHAVDKEASVFDFEAAEAYFGLRTLDDVALVVDQGQLERVQVGRLGSPFQRILDPCAQPSVGGVATLRVALVHYFTLVVEVQHGHGVLLQGAVEHGIACCVV